MPSIELSAIKDRHIEHPCIAVILNDDDPFNARRFDELVHASMQPTRYDCYLLNYIVFGATMYVFWDDLYHEDTAPLLRAQGVMGRLQSAGRVGMVLGKHGDSYREISDYSFGLHRAGKLSITASNAYQQTVIREKLGNHFILNK